MMKMATVASRSKGFAAAACANATAFNATNTPDATALRLLLRRQRII